MEIRQCAVADGIGCIEQLLCGHGFVGVHDRTVMAGVAVIFPSCFRLISALGAMPLKPAVALIEYENGFTVFAHKCRSCLIRMAVK
ncbi:Uncharacterised protein [Neisseria meningitidis]|nr:Uncharacterised protein [Neisseria meningitidis]